MVQVQFLENLGNSQNMTVIGFTGSALLITVGGTLPSQRLFRAPVSQDPGVPSTGLRPVAGHCQPACAALNAWINLPFTMYSNMLTIIKQLIICQATNTGSD